MVLEDTLHTKVRIPKGIFISEPGKTCSEVEEYTYPGVPDFLNVFGIDSSWCYLFIHHSKVSSFTARVRRDGVRCFIHKSVVYQRKKDTRGICGIERPTVSGLVFLQGTPLDLQNYLSARFGNYHLVNNCSTRQPAVIPNSVMLPFMRVLEISPERIRFLLHPFKYYAGGNIKLRIISGFLAGLEGYVIRIDRDRRLVMDVGGMSVAISGVHCEKFEIVEEKHTDSLSRENVAAAPPVRRLTELQTRIDSELCMPRNSSDVKLIAGILDLWKERAAIYQEKWRIAEAKDILFFLLEEIDWHYSSMFKSNIFDMSPVLDVARHIFMQIDAMTENTRYTEDTRQEIAVERDGSLARFGYLH